MSKRSDPVLDQVAVPDPEQKYGTVTCFGSDLTQKLRIRIYSADDQRRLIPDQTLEPNVDFYSIL
jgi:hypothetical protein